MSPLRAAVFGFLGLAAGSFLTVVVHRLPRAESVVAPASRCPSCGTAIAVRDNLPVLSYLLLGGRCRTCGAPISVRYPLTEGLTAALFVGAALRFDSPYVAAVMAVFLAVLVAVALIDAEHRIVPNRIVYPAAPAFAVPIVIGDLAGEPLDALRAAIGLLAFGGGMLAVALISPRGMGMGDVKLAALIGLVLGSLGLGPVAVAAAGAVLAGGVGAVAAVVLAGAGRKQAMPFGPFLAVGAVLAAFAGSEIADAYLRLLG